MLIGLAVAVALRNASRPSLALAVGAGVGALALLAFVLARYEAAVVLGMFIFGVVFVEPAPPDAILMTVIAVAIVTARFSLRRIPLQVLALVGVFLILNLVSTIFATSLGRAAHFLLITTYLCLFGVWLTSYVTSPRRARTIVAPLIGGAVIVAAIGVVLQFWPLPGSSIVSSEHLRVRGFFKDPNVFGPFCAFAAILVVSELVEPRLLRARRPLKLVYLIVLALGVLFSYSRAAWLSAAIAILTVIVGYGLRRGGGKKAGSIFVTLVVIAGTASIILAATGSVGFLDSRAHFQTYDVQRFAAQTRGLELVQSYPLGIGPGQFERTVGISAHSMYVRSIAEQGVAGLFVILAVLLATLGLAARNVVRGRDTFGVGSVPLLAAWCGILANGAFVDTIHWRHLWLVAGLIWAGAMRSSGPAEIRR